MPSSKPFKWRHFQSDLVLLNVRWYLRYSLSYRDLKEMMLERGVKDLLQKDKPVGFAPRVIINNKLKRYG